ncbi:MAG: M20/M25/M40 family metallo-hydrolase [Gemmatimonadota bacterium]
MQNPDGLDPITLLDRLIAIDSVNPDLVPGAAGEAEAASFCADWLGCHGFEVHRVGAADRPSVVGVVRGSGGGRSLMVTGHMDTVSVAGYDGDPLVPVHRDGKVFGRGAFDMKSGLAAIMIAAARAVQGKLAGDVIVACVADEEFGSAGTEAVLGHFSADAAIVAEPSQLEVTLAHRGFAWFDVVITGRAAHGSMPEQGIDAIAHAGKLIAALDRLRDRLESAPRHPSLGHGAVRVSTIRGGGDAATVAAECRLTVERRTLPGETLATVQREQRAILQDLAETVPGFSFALRPLVGRSAFEANPKWPIVTTLFAEAERVLGERPATRGEPFWTDAGLFDEAGIPCLLIGVKGGGAHAASEWVEVESVHQLTEILAGTITAFCA